jgi:hypothetical protein
VEALEGDGELKAGVEVTDDEEEERPKKRAGVKARKK